MNATPQRQSYAYRRNPAQSIHPSTFHPDHVSHGHGHGSAIQVRPIQTYYSTSPVAFQPAQPPIIIEQAGESAAAPSTTSKGGFNLASLTKYANIDELKGLMDRFGGLEGILSTVTTVQKVVSTVGQIAPMVKVMTGLIGKKSSNNETTTTNTTTIPARRKIKSTRPRSRSNQRSKSNSRKTSSNSSRSNQSRRSQSFTKQGL